MLVERFRTYCIAARSSAVKALFHILLLVGSLNPMSANIKVDELAPMVAELRSNWWKGVTRPASFRRQQLLQMRKMITEHFEEVPSHTSHRELLLL